MKFGARSRILPGIRLLSFPSPTHGWAATSSTLQYTVDGGSTWRPGGWPYGPIEWLDFVDTRNGWAKTLDEPGLFRTADGGTSWVATEDPCREATGGRYYTFATVQSGWALCTGQPATQCSFQPKELYRTVDGGNSWALLAETGHPAVSEVPSRVLPIPGCPRQINFLDESHGWVTTSSGSLWETADGGLSWTGLEVIPGLGRLTSVAFASQLQGFVHAGTLLATVDGGQSWTQVYPDLAPTGPRVQVSETYSIGFGTVLDGGAVLVSRDGERMWHQIASTPFMIESPVFADEQHGWALVSFGVGKGVYGTIDGGVTCKELMPAPVQPEENPAYLATAGPQLLFVRRGFGGILASEDGGTTLEEVWPQDSTSGPLDFVSRDVGWKVGSDLRLFATQDGGRSWDCLPLRHRVLNFNLTDDTHAWAIVNQCTGDVCPLELVSTADAGATWARYDLGELAVNGMHVFDACHVELHDQGGSLFETTDCGQTWSREVE